jgi:hypothetical protein
MLNQHVTGKWVDVFMTSIACMCVYTHSAVAVSQHRASRHNLCGKKCHTASSSTARKLCCAHLGAHNSTKEKRPGAQPYRFYGLSLGVKETQHSHHVQCTCRPLPLAAQRTAGEGGVCAAAAAAGCCHNSRSRAGMDVHATRVGRCSGPRNNTTTLTPALSLRPQPCARTRAAATTCHSGAPHTFTHNTLSHSRNSLAVLRQGSTKVVSKWHPARTHTRVQGSTTRDSLAARPGKLPRGGKRRQRRAGVRANSPASPSNIRCKACVITARSQPTSRLAHTAAA